MKVRKWFKFKRAFSNSSRCATFSISITHKKMCLYVGLKEIRLLRRFSWITFTDYNLRWGNKQLWWKLSMEGSPPTRVNTVIYSKCCNLRISSHLFYLTMPLGFPSIFSPCFFHSPHHTPHTTLSSSTSVTAALRPGSQEQLVCLPALLTSANLWLEGTLTSLPTTQPHIQPQTLLSS